MIADDDGFPATEELTVHVEIDGLTRVSSELQGLSGGEPKDVGDAHSPATNFQCDLDLDVPDEIKRFSGRLGG